MSYRTTTWQNVTITWYRQPEVEVYFFLTLLAFLSLLLIRDRWFSAPCKCDTYLVSSTRSRGFISVHCRHRGLFLPNPHFTFPVSDAPLVPSRTTRRPDDHDADHDDGSVCAPRPATRLCRPPGDGRRAPPHRAPNAWRDCPGTGEFYYEWRYCNPYLHICNMFCTCLLLISYILNHIIIWYLRILRFIMLRMKVYNWYIHITFERRYEIIFTFVFIYLRR